MRIPGWFGGVVVLGLALGCGSDNGKGNGNDGGGAGGAGGGAGGGSMFACDYANYSGTGYHWCWTWDASNFPMPAQLLAGYQSACTQGMGTPVAACSTSGAVGKCTFTTVNGAYSIAQSIFYYAPIDRATAMQACMVQNAQGTTASWTSF